MAVNVRLIPALPSEEAFAPNQDTPRLAGLLHRMRARGWLEAEWGVSPKGRRAKFYALTAAGEAELARGRGEWRAYTTAVDKVFAAGRATGS